MQLQITGRHTHLTDEERAVFSEKLGKYEKKVAGLTKIDAVVNSEGGRQDAEVILHVAHSNPIVARASAVSHMAALDLIIGKLDNLVSRLNEKMHNHHKSKSSDSIE